MTRAVHGFGWSLKRTHTSPVHIPLKQQLLVAFLVLILLFSAFSVIYLKDLSRRLYIQYQQLQYKQQQSEEEWSKLLLERGAWSTQARVQHIASTELNMVVPKVGEVVLIENAK
jgi:cell division protein FtsL